MMTSPSLDETPTLSDKILPIASDPDDDYLLDMLAYVFHIARPTLVDSKMMKPWELPW
jgi:hypothetical protein